MNDTAQIRELVGSAVNAVFDEEAGRLRETVLRRVLEQLEGQRAVTADGGATAQLQEAVAAIERGGTQAEILHALLERTAAFAERCAVFLIRGRSAIEWQQRGFRNPDVLKAFALDLEGALAQQAVARCSVQCGAVSDFDARFMDAAGAPTEGRCAVGPLLVRDSNVGLLYADAGTGSVALDPCALQVLIRVAAFCLELVALRKTGTPVSDEISPSPAAPENDHTETVAETSVAPASDALLRGDPASAGGGQTSAPAAAAQAPVAAAADDEIHRKARRFAKLLVEEIKLYNMAKVKDGKQHRNLYARLRDDIEKSRASYDQRYGNTPIAEADYFTQELVRGLAEGDPSLFGSNFPG
jgi:hypothetical protein